MVCNSFGDLAITNNRSFYYCHLYFPFQHGPGYFETVTNDFAMADERCFYLAIISLFFLHSTFV